jgi:uncharacterized protein (DUF1499 family)
MIVTMRRAVLWAGCLIAAASVVALVLGPVGTRAGWWTFRSGFTLLRWSVYLGLAGAAVSLVGGLLSRRWFLAAAALVTGLVVAAVPWQLRRAAGGVPVIHDISTDTRNPPAFVAILPLRANAANPPDYRGPEVAEQQRRAYPDIQPLVLDLPRAEAFDRAIAAAREMDWEIVAAEPADGRIEAVDTTFWFGFKDDVVIRVSGSGGASRLDIRSKSRVGRGDAGANAKRIRAYLARLRP